MFAWTAPWLRYRHMTSCHTRTHILIHEDSWLSITGLFEDFSPQIRFLLAQVEEYGFAWQAGLRQGSRLVEICKVAAVTLTHEQMIDLLRTSVTVKVIIIPPYEEGGPRRCVYDVFEVKLMSDLFLKRL